MHMERQASEARLRSSLTPGPSLEGRGLEGLSSAVDQPDGDRHADADGGADQEALRRLAADEADSDDDDEGERDNGAAGAGGFRSRSHARCHGTGSATGKERR